MRDVMTPQLELVAYALLGEQVGEALRIGETLVLPRALAANQGQVGVAAEVLEFAAMEVGDVSHWVVEINLFGSARAGEGL